MENARVLVKLYIPNKAGLRLVNVREIVNFQGEVIRQQFDLGVIRQIELELKELTAYLEAIAYKARIQGGGYDRRSGFFGTFY